MEMAYRAFWKRMRIAEVPIIFYQRRAGASKVSMSIMRESALGVIGLRLRR